MADKVEKYTEHPSIVVIGGKPRLRVFEDFFIEEQLPKWRKIQVKIDSETHDRADSKVESSMDMRGDPVDVNWSLHTGAINDGRSERALLYNARSDRRSYVNRRSTMSDVKNIVVDTRKKSWFRRVLDKFKKKEDDTVEGMPVDQVFSQVKTAMMSPTNEDLVKAEKIINTVEKTLNASGQYAIAEKLVSNRGVLAAEIALVNAGCLKYISEEQVIQFMLKSEKGVRVEYLRFYPNILPNEVARTKIAFDGLLVFDNYVVMYYDPGTTKFSLIEEHNDDEERRRRRDPILFGVMKGSRKLYYVADWVTADDDLTLDKLEVALGEKALDLGEENLMGTQETISKYLDRVIVNIEAETQMLAEQGRLLTEENLEDFVVNGVAPKPLERQLRSMGITPWNERVGGKSKKDKKKKRKHGKKK